MTGLGKNGRPKETLDFRCERQLSFRKPDIEMLYLRLGLTGDTRPKLAGYIMGQIAGNQVESNQQ